MTRAEQQLHDAQRRIVFQRSLAALDARIAAGFDPRCVTDSRGVQHVAETHLDAFLIQSRSAIPTWPNGGLW